MKLKATFKLTYFIFRYKYEDRSQLGPSTLPTCKTYDDAVKQHEKWKKAQEKEIKESEQQLEKFLDEEAERKWNEMSEENLDTDRKVRAAREEVEVLNCKLHEMLYMYIHVYSYI